MEVMKAIKERRSIRKYTDQPVSDKQINDILTAGMYAPSGGNQQARDFIVIKDREKLQAITQIHPYASMLKDASVAIIVCGNLDKERFQGLWIQDCSATTQNILLAAYDLGLGSVWLGVYPEEDRVQGLKLLFNTPNHIIPFSIIALGYPDEEKQTPERYVSESIHYETW